jgi:hypothetical protein
MSEIEEKRDKEVIQILIKNTSELNNKIELLRNSEKKYIGENAKLLVEMIEYKSKINMANMEIERLKEEIKNMKKSDYKENEEQAKVLPSQNEEPKKKDFHHIDFLEEKKRYIKNWKTLNENKMRREEKTSKLKKPEKIEL